MKALVIGLGNPILGDDGVGWKVVDTLTQILGSNSPVELDRLAVGGLSLMERMLGHERVIIVDSIETGQSPEGSVKAFPLAALENPRLGHSASTHDTSLMTALQTAQTMGMKVPARVHVVAIEIKNAYDFSESLSPAVEHAVPIAAQKVLHLLKEDAT